MENRNIIIILVVIIVILAIVAGFMFTQSINPKEPTKIKITSDKEQYEGGKLSLQLTDLNKTPVSDEIVNVTIINGKGKVVFDNVVKTDSKGKAKLDLDLKKGKYNVTVDGNSLEGPEVDSHGVSKQQVMQSGYSDVKYDSENGIYVKYDPKTGVYHDWKVLIYNISWKNCK